MGVNNKIKVSLMPPYSELTKDGIVGLRFKPKYDEKIMIIDMTVSDETLAEMFEKEFKKQFPDWIVTRIP